MNPLIRTFCLFGVPLVVLGCSNSITIDKTDNNDKYEVTPGVVQNHFNAKAVYTNSNKCWTLDITTDLQTVYPNASIRMGFEVDNAGSNLYDVSLSNGKDDICFFQNNDGSKDDFITISIEDYHCHATVLLGPIMKNTIAENVFYNGTLSNLDAKISRGEKLTQGEKDLYSSLKKRIESNNLNWMRQMSGRCYIMVDDIKYYKESFTIPSH